MSEEKFYKAISDVADELKVPSHVIRFWETKFSIISPLKRAGGRRFYGAEDVAILKKIKDLLYNHSYSIKSVQKAIDAGSFSDIIPSKDVINHLPLISSEPNSRRLGADIPKIIRDLEEIKATLNKLVS